MTINVQIELLITKLHRHLEFLRGAFDLGRIHSVTMQDIHSLSQMKEYQ